MDTLLCVSGVCKWCVMFHSIVHRVIYIHKYMHTCNTYVRTCMFVQKFSICVILKLCANFNEQSLPMFSPIAVAFFRVSNTETYKCTLSIYRPANQVVSKPNTLSVAQPRHSLPCFNCVLQSLS